MDHTQIVISLDRKVDLSRRLSHKRGRSSCLCNRFSMPRRGHFKNKSRKNGLRKGKGIRCCSLSTRQSIPWAVPPSQHIGTAVRRRSAVQAPASSIVDRGGSITYHGPGQVVGYPILKLSSYCAGPKQYVRKLEEVVIHTLLRWGIAGYRMEKKPGVWVRWNHADAKIAAIGVRIDHGVTIHGFALNVDLDLSPFSYILPCGLAQCHITSMAEVRQVRRLIFSRRATGRAGIRTDVQHSMDESLARQH